MMLENNYRCKVKSSKHKLHTISVIHYNPGTVTNFTLPVKLKGIDFKSDFW